MRRFSPLTVFVLSAFGWLVALTLLWSKVGAWTSYPVGVISQVALDRGAPSWVRQVQLTPGNMEVDTSIEVPVEGGRYGELVLEASPMRYAYGLPIFLALLLAARGQGRVWRAFAGYALLLPAQAFSLTFYLLMQLMLATQFNANVLWISSLQMELIVYAYQLGTLVLPTLVPILLWLWMDRAFVNDVLVQGWRKMVDSEVQPES